MSYKAETISNGDKKVISEKRKFSIENKNGIIKYNLSEDKNGKKYNLKGYINEDQSIEKENDNGNKTYYSNDNNTLNNIDKKTYKNKKKSFLKNADKKHDEKNISIDDSLDNCLFLKKKYPNFIKEQQNFKNFDKIVNQIFDNGIFRNFFDDPFFSIKNTIPILKREKHNNKNYEIPKFNEDKMAMLEEENRLLKQRLDKLQKQINNNESFKNIKILEGENKSLV